MKERILRYLYDFTKGDSQDLANEIIAQLDAEGIKLTPVQLREKSGQVLKLLLHRYSEFAVSTIDAFFQRVIRSFTRETGLLGNFRLEVDNELVAEEAVALIMDELTHDAELRQWVIDYSIDRLKEGEKWDIRNLLVEFAGILSLESFKQIEEGVYANTQGKSFFQRFKRELSKRKFSIEHYVAERAGKILEEMAEHQITSDDLAGKSTGLWNYINKLKTDLKLPSPTVAEVISDATKWPHKQSPQRALVLQLATKCWQPQLYSLQKYIEENLPLHASAAVVSENLPWFGLLADLMKQQRKYLNDENLMLLSDASKFLNKIMNEQDTSFIYEKVGSFYRHYLIDEFQDTSALQWKNLLPLVQNGVAQNHKSLIVGDIKQSIYRWRGGDLNILQNQVKSDVSEQLTEIHSLDTNYRSARSIVNFNNELFQVASKVIASETSSDFPIEAYADAPQKFAKSDIEGFVRVEVLQPGEDLNFREQSLLNLPACVEELQASGVRMHDIAFLVRDNKDGQLIAKRFIEYKSAGAKDGFNYEVVSNESLLLHRATCVTIIINALRVLHNETDVIARANLACEYQKLWPTKTVIEWDEVFAATETKQVAKWMPAVFLQHRHYLSSLSLFEMVENIIQIFNLGQLAEEIIHVQSFQDVVQEFVQRERSDLAAFLEWWAIYKEKKSILVPSGVEAAQIITIHRAKGLQFKYVIIPFLDWELGHKKSPVLWVKSNHELFERAGDLPVRYKSDLNKTFFNDAYEQERKRAYLDSLNLLYVALTRAEIGLMAFAPFNGKPDVKHVGQLVWRSISQSALAGSVSGEFKFETGSIKPSTDVNKQAGTVALKTYSVSQWRDRLVLRKSGKDYFTQSEKRVKINHGVLVHAVLAKVRYASEADNILELQVKSGMISEEEKDEMDKMLQWILGEPSLQPCFATNAIHKMEATIFSREGEERRVDRVSIRGNEAWVLDYKTGEKKPEDVEQVSDYCRLLKEMGIDKVSGMLLYMAKQKIVFIS